MPYGGVENPNNILLKVSSAWASNRMAQQCCSLEFKKEPTTTTTTTTDTSNDTMDEISFAEDSSFYIFHLDQAWWTEYLQRYADEET
mmetsp:Transcript_18788/g.46553  ORF Transcript_18788/g.46553 Transcript_18788/m.46553 type:complete len:87 (+) Transcript_18788:1179-1439(+)